MYLYDTALGGRKPPNRRILVPRTSLVSALKDAPRPSVCTRRRRNSGHRNVQWFRGGLIFEAHRLCVSLNPRIESNKEEEEFGPPLAQTCSTETTRKLFFEPDESEDLFKKNAHELSE